MACSLEVSPLAHGRAARRDQASVMPPSMRISVPTM
jgi:hypothetical protein